MQLDPYAKGPERVILSGADVSEPEQSLPEKVAAFNHDPEQPFLLRFGTPADYEKIVNKHEDRSVVRGELNPIFQGIYSTRIELKQMMREIETLLVAAEKLSAIAEYLGEPADRKSLDQAWEPVLFNQTHDLASGVMLDKVYEDTLRGYNFSRRLGEETLEKSIGALTSHIDTSGPGIPIVVFNSLGWSRTDVARVDIGMSESGAQVLKLRDSNDKDVPFQLIGAKRNADGGLRSAQIVFVAHDVPSLGFSLYHLRRFNESLHGDHSSEANFVTGTQRVDQADISNGFYRARIGLWTGELQSLVVQEDRWEALKKPGNLVAREDDNGDLWQLYGSLDGARFTAMTRKVGLPNLPRTVWSNENVGQGEITRGPVYEEYHGAHPFGKNTFETTIRLYQDIPRVEITTEIVNREPFVRYRVLFPATITSGTNTQEIPFGAVERPQAQEFPAQNWIDLQDGTHGLALLNQGMPGANVANDTLMLSLMRSTRLISYGVGGGFELGVPSDTALEIGRPLSFHYAVQPHLGDWRAAKIFRSGLEFNHPLIAKVSAAHSGNLHSSWSFLNVTPASVVLSAVKPAAKRGEVIIRVYEGTGQSVPAGKMTFAARLLSAEETNLVEESSAQIPISQNSFTFRMHPFEIKTFRLRFE